MFYFHYTYADINHSKCIWNVGNWILTSNYVLNWHRVSSNTILICFNMWMLREHDIFLKISLNVSLFPMCLYYHLDLFRHRYFISVGLHRIIMCSKSVICNFLYLFMYVANANVCLILCQARFHMCFLWFYNWLFGYFVFIYSSRNTVSEMCIHTHFVSSNLFCNLYEMLHYGRKHNFLFNFLTNVKNFLHSLFT